MTGAVHRAGGDDQYDGAAMTSADLDRHATIGGEMNVVSLGLAQALALNRIDEAIRRAVV